MKQILEDQALSAKEFADKIGVQASSISHIITGRNKPSVELIQKMLEVFPEMDLFWLMTGKKKEEEQKAPKPDDLESSHVGENPENKASMHTVVCFYEDGTFERYDARN